MRGVDDPEMETGNSVTRSGLFTSFDPVDSNGWMQRQQESDFVKNIIIIYCHYVTSLSFLARLSC